MHFPTLDSFIQAVCAVTTSAEAKTFFESYVEYLETNHPSVKAPLSTARADIGWVFGEGMPAPMRRVWGEATGAEHPTLGPDYTYREFSPAELFQCGVENGQKGVERYRPTPWRSQLS